MIGWGALWPAECRNCDLVTDDPDAFLFEDDELMPANLRCPTTGRIHRWRSLYEALKERNRLRAGRGAGAALDAGDAGR